MQKRSILLNGMAVVTAAVAVLFIAADPYHGDVHIEKEHWSFQGFFGKFDHEQLRRGFTVYKDVCSACHSMDLMAYRNLEQIGFSADEVREIAASVEVTDGPNDAGEMFERPGKASDRFKAPFIQQAVLVSLGWSAALFAAAGVVFARRDISGS